MAARWPFNQDWLTRLLRDAGGARGVNSKTAGGRAAWRRATPLMAANVGGRANSAPVSRRAGRRTFKGGRLGRDSDLFDGRPTAAIGHFDSKGGEGWRAAGQ